MTVKEITDRALALLGYEPENDYYRCALIYVKSILQDVENLTGEEAGDIQKITDDVMLNERIKDTVTYGTAAFIARSVGDGDSQSYFAEIFRLKRKSLAGMGQIEDVLPAI